MPFTGFDLLVLVNQVGIHSGGNLFWGNDILFCLSNSRLLQKREGQGKRSACRLSTTGKSQGLVYCWSAGSWCSQVWSVQFITLFNLHNPYPPLCHAGRYVVKCLQFPQFWQVSRFALLFISGEIFCWREQVKVPLNTACINASFVQFMQGIALVKVFGRVKRIPRASCQMFSVSSHRA